MALTAHEVQRLTLMRVRSDRVAVARFQIRRHSHRRPRATIEHVEVILRQRPSTAPFFFFSAGQ